MCDLNARTLVLFTILIQQQNSISSFSTKNNIYKSSLSIDNTISNIQNVTAIDLSFYQLFWGRISL